MLDCFSFVLAGCSRFSLLKLKLDVEVLNLEFVIVLLCFFFVLVVECIFNSIFFKSELLIKYYVIGLLT